MMRHGQNEDAFSGLVELIEHGRAARDIDGTARLVEPYG